MTDNERELLILVTRMVLYLFINIQQNSTAYWMGDRARELMQEIKNEIS